MADQTPIKTRSNFNQKLNKIDPSEIRDQRSEKGKDYYSPNPSFSLQREIWHHLTAGLYMLSDNDYGRPWPNPNRATIARCIAEFPADLCLKAAIETREIVQAQDRAPSITGLFEKKLRDLAGVRAEARESLEGAA